MEQFRAVIIGGGVAGTSIAYHLAELGWKDVLLVDRDQLTSGSTFHSAGLVGQLRSSVSLTRMMMYSADLYRRLHAETGVDPDWHEVGSLRLASSAERMQELTRLEGWGQTFGLPLSIVSTEEALEQFPLFNPEGVLGAAFLPTDGHLDPSGLAYALAEGAKRRGVEIRTNARVTGITIDRGRVTGVTTDKGDLAADIVVNAGGMYANQIGRLAGVEVPVVPFAHQYLVTKPIEGVRPDFPTMRDPDRLIYFRAEGGGSLVMGGYERNPAPWAVADGPPPDFNNTLLPEDWERFEPLAEAAFGLVPAMSGAEIVKMINGPEAFTPDGEFILGESEVRGFFVATGFCAHGIAGAGGIGKVVADWIVHGEPEYDLWKMDIRRFGGHYRSRGYALARAYEVYSTYYDIHYPGEERTAGRPLKTAPTYSRLQELGAAFGEKSGWERANWFASNEDPTHEAHRPVGWAGEHWSTAIVAEHLATRERAGLFDESSFAKIEVGGPGAAAFLQRLCANDVDRSPGAVVYTQLLNARGGIECDLTVSRLDEERFLLVTGTAFGNHDIGWIRKQLWDWTGDQVSVRDVTASLTCFGLWGPLSRDILGAVSSADLSNGAFPYMTWRDIVVGYVPCRAVRVTYVGELGWELYAGIEFAGRLWDTLMEAGAAHGLVPAGYRAIDSLRLEKGYRAWGADITPEENPFQAGLGFAVRMEKPGFIGNEALEKAQSAVTSRLSCLTLADARAMCLGNEPVFHQGKVISRVTSGGIGYTVGASIAYAYLPIELASPGTPCQIEVFGQRVGATVAAEPLWDPKGLRIRA
jgi:glycine cleavage system aminomethyltransferase T/glycine/D-amino acid oxidase-like deaminating enzyme